MTSCNLREFLQLLENRGELVRVRAPVSRDLEITEIVDRISKGPPEKNKALLFENVEGFSMPVAVNLFGSAPRMAWALGVDDLNDLAERLGRLLWSCGCPRGWGRCLSGGPNFWGC